MASRQNSWQQVFALITHRIKQVIGLYVFVLGPMWLMFVLNKTILFGWWNQFGIRPRQLSLPSLIGVLTSWTMHGNLAHIIGNSVVLVQILFLFGLFESKAYRTIAILVVGSGFMTWGLGSSWSIHIGASGLAYAMLGYMIGGAIFAKRWGYLIACLVMGAGYWLIIKQGLIPQTGVSFAGHFGGLCIGLLLGARSDHQYTKLSHTKLNRLR